MLLLRALLLLLGSAPGGRASSCASAPAAGGVGGARVGCAEGARGARRGGRVLRGGADPRPLALPRLPGGSGCRRHERPRGAGRAVGASPGARSSHGAPPGRGLQRGAPTGHSRPFLLAPLSALRLRPRLCSPPARRGRRPHVALFILFPSVADSPRRGRRGSARRSGDSPAFSGAGGGERKSGLGAQVRTPRAPTVQHPDGARVGREGWNWTKKRVPSGVAGWCPRGRRGPEPEREGVQMGSTSRGQVLGAGPGG